MKSRPTSKARITVVLSSMFAFCGMLHGQDSARISLDEWVRSNQLFPPGEEGRVRSTWLTSEDLAIFNDPAFKRRFAQSYISETEIEPKVDEDERELIIKIMDLISEDDLAGADEAAAAAAPEPLKKRKSSSGPAPLSKRQSSTGGLTGAMASLRTSRRGSAESLVAADEDAEMEEDEGEGDEEEEEGADPLADGKRWRSKPGKPGATRKARGAAASGVANPLDDLEDANPLEDGKRWRDKPSRPGATRKPKPKPDAQAKEQARQALPAGM